MSRDVGQGMSDIPGFGDQRANAIEKMTHKCGRRRLSVCTGHRDYPRIGEISKGQVYLAHQRSARLPGRDDRIRLRVYSRAHDHPGGSRYPFKVVTTNVHRRTEIAEAACRVLQRQCRSCIRHVHSIPVGEKELCRCNPALAEAEHRDFGVLPSFARHLSLRVLSARNAQSIPRIQKRTTTWLSSQPPFSKWW